MTEEERKEKLQQLTDNKIRLLQEQLLLEDKQRDLFGIKVPDTSFSEELENATNYWLSPENLCNMVHTYLKLRLEPEKEYILGEKAIKTLRVSREARSALLEDNSKYKIPKGKENRAWVKLLKQGDLHIRITFDGNSVKNEKDVELISMSHPLVKQAAAFLESENKTVTVFRAKTNEFQSGEYPFAVFQWKMSGDREDLQLKPISSYPELNNSILNLLKKSENLDIEIGKDPENWDDVEMLHHSLWEEELVNHRQRTRELIQYKTGSLTTSHNARMAQLEEQLEKATNSRIRRMKEGEIRNAVADYEHHMEELEQAIKKADILPETLAYGLLIVEPDNSPALMGDSKKTDDRSGFDKKVNQKKESFNTFREAISFVNREYGRQIILQPEKMISLLNEIAPQFNRETNQLQRISEAGVFHLLTGESGPNVDGAFEIMIENLGYTEEEAEKIFQNLEPFFE